jgi:hypothetical protein
MQNIQREEVAKHDSDVALLSVTSNIVAVSDDLAALDSQQKALDKSISARAKWVSEQPALRHAKHEEFVKISSAYAAGENLITKVLSVLQEFYDHEQQSEGELRSKSTLLRGNLQGVQGGVPTILGVPTKYIKQDCSLAQSLMKSLRSHVVTSISELEKTEQVSVAEYQTSENTAKIAQVAEEKLRSQKQHSKAVLETRLVKYQCQRAQLVEDQRNINLRLQQLHHDCDVISHSMEAATKSVTDAGNESSHTGTAWIRAHHGLVFLQRWKFVVAFFLLSMGLLLLLLPLVSMLGTLFQCSLVAFVMPRHDKSLSNPKIYSDVSADDHLG